MRDLDFQRRGSIADRSRLAGRRALSPGPSTLRRASQRARMPGVSQPPEPLPDHGASSVDQLNEPESLGKSSF
jgi:hypothetical protein